MSALMEMFHDFKKGPFLWPSMEAKTKDFMFDVFVPALHGILKTSDPEAYEAYHGNCCRQTAVMGCLILRQLMPNKEWRVYEGAFDDIVQGRSVHYEHAWIYGAPSTFGDNWLVDLSRTVQERLFIVSAKNAYPSTHPDYRYMQCIQTKEIVLNGPLLYEVREFYTKLRGFELYARILEEMNQIIEQTTKMEAIA